MYDISNSNDIVALFVLQCFQLNITKLTRKYSCTTKFFTMNFNSLF